jgi:glycine/D-amino acid oxidase-like deaminating enzyme
MRLDALIFGGGAAGLWLLDRLSRDGHHVLLLEAHSLGSGQTVASQGIIHGGLKYTLSGLLTNSARNIREMPTVWRESLLGNATPDLSQTQLRSGCCYLWQTDSMASRAGMIGARFGLQIKPETISTEQRPAALKGVFGTVARLPEQVISPQSFIKDLATQYRDRILQIDAREGLEFELTSPGEVAAVRLTSPGAGSPLKLQPRQVIFTAGGGNARLRELAGLSGDVMQKRPLHMVMVRGNLPELNGHCLDGAKTRVTITSETDVEGRMVWQIGGQIAEDGVKFDPISLTERARSELASVLPGVDLGTAEWSTYTVDRAEGATTNGSRPETIQVLCAGNVTTGWPTKLVLAPVLAQEIASRATSPYVATDFDTTPFANWPRPEVATLPWEDAGRRWWTLADVVTLQKRRAA